MGRHDLQATGRYKKSFYKRPRSKSKTTYNKEWIMGKISRPENVKQLLTY